MRQSESANARRAMGFNRFKNKAAMAMGGLISMASSIYLYTIYKMREGSIGSDPAFTTLPPLEDNDEQSS